MAHKPREQHIPTLPDAPKPIPYSHDVIRARLYPLEVPYIFNLPTSYKLYVVCPPGTPLRLVRMQIAQHLRGAHVDTMTVRWTKDETGRKADECELIAAEWGG